MVVKIIIIAGHTIIVILEYFSLWGVPRLKILTTIKPSAANAPFHSSWYNLS